MNFISSASNYLASIENITGSSGRSSLKPSSCSDLMKTDHSDNDSFRRPNKTKATSSSKQATSHHALNNASESESQRPAACNFSLTLNIVRLDAESSNFDLKAPQFSQTICWTVSVDG